MNCPNCKNPVSPNARFCGTCGQVVQSAAAADPSMRPPPSPIVPGVPGAAAVAAGPATGASSAWTATQTALPGILQRIKNILVSPRIEWPVIASEPTSIQQLFIGYVLPLAALVALLTFIRMSLIGVSMPFGGTLRMPLVSSLESAVISCVFGCLGVFIAGLIINGLAPTFGGTRDTRQALKVAAYSFTPAYLSSVLALSPVMPRLLQFVAGLYGIYLLYLGLPVVMRSAGERAVGYTAAVVICTILLGILFGVMAGALGIFGHASGLMGSNAGLMGYDTAQSRLIAQQQGAAAVGNIIGSALGTDAQGKAGLTAALSNLAKAGEQSMAATSAANSAPINAPLAPPASQSAAPATSSAADSAPTLAAVGGLASALGGALAGDHRVEVVDFKSLTALLPPDLPGMRRTDSRGETQAAIGVKTASATGTYQGDNGAAMHIEITDLSAVSGLIGLAGALEQESTSQSDTGFERNASIGGRSVHEKYDSRARHGELTVMLAKRFQVELTGDGVDISTLEQALGHMDLGRLESMKDQGGSAK
ncbi:MAG TPA: YIP1 family protein [Steroidobacteraceae bacterium]